MPRYFFDIKNGHRLVDPSGLDCKDEAAAIEAGRTIARQIADDTSSSGARRLAIIEGHEVRAVVIGYPKGSGPAG